MGTEIKPLMTSKPHTPNRRRNRTMRRRPGVNTRFGRSRRSVNRAHALNNHRPNRKNTPTPIAAPAAVTPMTSHGSMPRATISEGVTKNLITAATIQPITSSGPIRQRFDPYAKSPASPNPGTMYPRAVVSSSMAAAQISTGAAFRTASTPSRLAMADATTIREGRP